MRFWALTRREMVGLLRSLRYDFGRQDALSRQRTHVLYPQYDAYERPTRRGFAVTGVGLAVAGAAAGTYLAVAGGLAGLVAHPHSGIEDGPARNGSVATPGGVVGARHAAPGPPASPVRSTAPVHPWQPREQAAVPAEPSCVCALPPVPTPVVASATPSTATPSAEESIAPSPTPPPSGSPSTTESSAG